MGYRKPYYNEDHKLVRYGIGDFFKDSVNAVISFFSPRKIKYAFRSVTSAFPEFFVFFLALLLLQSCFWLVRLRQDSYAADAKKEAYSGDGCNLIVEGISDEAWTVLYNKTFVFLEEYTAEERGFTEYTKEHYYTADADSMYRLRFWLNEDSTKYAESFLKRYKLNSEEFSYSFGERTGYLNKIEKSGRSAGMTLFWLSMLTAVVISLLFYLRTNRNKFMYGIFVSFGGGFSTLMETAGWEMFAIALLTFIPSCLLALGIQAAFCASSGATFVFNASRIPDALFWVLFSVLLAVVPGVYSLTHQTPLRLLSAQDNSNYVSSPRRSFRIFRKSFPFHYELYGFVRFRKYYMLLVASSVVFTTLFSCGLFVAEMKKTDEQASQASFELSTGTSALDMSDVDAIDDIPGVAYTLWSSSVQATEKRSFVLLSKRQASGITSKTVKDKKSGLYADNNCRYCLLSDRLADEVEKGLWKIDGDLDAVTGGSYTVAVSCSINNRNVMKFKVGDTIRIAVFDSAGSPISFEKPDRKYQLSTLISGAYFNYIDVTVGAVVDDGDTTDTYAIYMPDALFEEVTGKSPDVTSASVYLDGDIDNAEVSGIRDKIVKILSYYEGYSVIDTDATADLHLAEKNSAAPGILAGAWMILVICPCVWFLAQSDFVNKREKEIYMLTAMGGTDRSLLKLFLFSGGVLTVLASLVTATLGSLLNYLIYYTVNVFLPSLGMGSSVRYEYSFSPLGFLVCVLVSAAGAMLSTCLPFLIFIKKRDKNEKLSSAGGVRG